MDWFLYDKVKVLKTFKISSDCPIKTCRSLKRRAFLKIFSTVFIRRTCYFSWLQIETSKKSASCVQAKTNSNFAKNLAEMLKEGTTHFCVP